MAFKIHSEVYYMLHMLIYYFGCSPPKSYLQCVNGTMYPRFDEDWSKTVVTDGFQTQWRM